MAEYIVGATYKASATHIKNAKTQHTTFNNAEGVFKVSALSSNGGAWSHDASYGGEFHPELKGVGVYCASPHEIDDDELISLPVGEKPEGETQ